MTLRWERRVRGALLSQSSVPVPTRISAALLVARIRLRRWSRRTAFVVTAIVGMTVVAALVVALAALLLRVA
jgi:hypothetical protein